MNSTTSGAGPRLVSVLAIVSVALAGFVTGAGAAWGTIGHFHRFTFS